MGFWLLVSRTLVARRSAVPRNVGITFGLLVVAALRAVGTTRSCEQTSFEGPTTTDNISRVSAKLSGKKRYMRGSCGFATDRQVLHNFTSYLISCSSTSRREHPTAPPEILVANSRGVLVFSTATTRTSWHLKRHGLCYPHSSTDAPVLHAARPGETVEMISDHKRRKSCDVGLAPVTVDRRALLSSVLEPDHSLERCAAWARSAEQSAFFHRASQPQDCLSALRLNNADADDAVHRLE